MLTESNNGTGFVRDMISFVKKHKYVVIALLVFSFIVYGSMVFYPSLSIDEEVSLNLTGVTRWMTQGRFGISLLDFFLTQNSGRFTPFLWELLGVLLWGIAALIGGYNVSRLSRKRTAPFQLFAFCAVYISVPFVSGELLSFSMFAVEVALGLIAAETAAALTYACFRGEKKRLLLVSLALLLFAASVYQAIVTVYIIYIVLYGFFCFARREKTETNVRPKEVYQNVGLGALIACGSTAIYFGINALINHFFAADSGYLSDNYIGWGKGDGLLREAFMAFANVVRILFGITIEDAVVYGGAVIGVTTVIFLLVSLYFFIKTDKKLHFLLFAAVAAVSPFVMTVLLGIYRTPGRMYPALPVLMAAAWYLLLGMDGKKFARVLASAACICVLFLQAQYTNKLSYSNYLSFTNDTATANHLIYDIEKLEPAYAEKPFVFIGARRYERNQDVMPYIRGTVHGVSFFEHDDGSNSRMVKFMNGIGFQVLMPTKSQMETGLARSGDMPSWPADGSVLVLDDMIVIKLSAPSKQWYDTNGMKAAPAALPPA